MSFFSEIRCMKYAATSDAFRDAMKRATRMAATVPRWSVDIATVISVRAMSVTKTVT